MRRDAARQAAVFAQFALTLHQAVAVIDGKRHQGRGFVAGVAEHQTLVARALVQVDAFAFVHALGDVRRLLVVVHADCAAVGVKAQLGGVVADAFDGFAGDFDVVHLGCGGDFACQYAQACVDQGFCGDTRFGVLRQDGIQNRIGHLVGNFIRMAFGYRFEVNRYSLIAILSLKNRLLCFQTAFISDSGNHNKKLRFFSIQVRNIRTCLLFRNPVARFLQEKKFPH